MDHEYSFAYLVNCWLSFEICWTCCVTYLSFWMKFLIESKGSVISAINSTKGRWQVWNQGLDIPTHKLKTEVSLKALLALIVCLSLSTNGMCKAHLLIIQTIQDSPIGKFSNFTLIEVGPIIKLNTWLITR